MDTPPNPWCAAIGRSAAPLEKNLEYRLRRAGLNSIADAYVASGFSATYDGFPIAHRILSVRPCELGEEDSEAEVENLARAVFVAHPDVDRDRFLGSTLLEAYLRRGSIRLDTLRLMILGGASPAAGTSSIAAYLDGVALSAEPAQRPECEEALQFLIEHGADPTAPNSFSALCRYGFFDRVQLALEAGVNPNARGMHDRPLITAARHGHLEIVCLLLQNGADPNLLSAVGLSPLAEAKSGEIVRMLVEYGASLTIRHADGSTPLTYAAGFLSPARVQLLLELGADPNLPALDGTTALSAAQFQYDDAHRVAILGLLRMRGAH